MDMNPLMEAFSGQDRSEELFGTDPLPTLQSLTEGSHRDPLKKLQTMTPGATTDPFEEISTLSQDQDPMMQMVQMLMKMFMSQR
jgi:hypothetical protein